MSVGALRALSAYTQSVLIYLGAPHRYSRGLGKGEKYYSYI